MAHIAMACVVLAYIAMTCIVMAISWREAPVMAHIYHAWIGPCRSLALWVDLPCDACRADKERTRLSNFFLYGMADVVWLD